MDSDYNEINRAVNMKQLYQEEPCILLDEKKIKSLLHCNNLSIALLEKTESTNDYFKDPAHKSKKPAVCIAEMQTQGRGRLGRPWHSPFGQNIYLSLHYPIQKDISKLSGLSLVIALAISKAIDNSCALPELTLVKWPNDIIAQDKKLSGTLIEMEAESHGVSHLIIGIAINVNMEEASKRHITQPWVSLRQLTSSYHDRNPLCAELLNQVLLYLEKFMAEGLAIFIKEWHSKDYLFHRQVSLKSNAAIIKGVGSGINQHGQLILTLPDGSEHAFSSGDTMLMKK